MVSFRKIDNFYVWGIKGIIFLMPFIPLYVSPSIVFPYITGKNFAFRIMVELAAALWLGLISTNKEYRLRSSPITLSILFFTFIVGLADLFGVNPFKSFWSNYERMEGYITILHLALYFLIASSVLRTKRDWEIIFNICVVVSVLVSLYALSAPQLTAETSRHAWEYGARVSGTIGNPPFLASYLLLSVFFCLILIVNTQKPHLKFLYLLPIIINIFTIYFSASRGAMLAALMAAVILSMFYIFGKSESAKEKTIKKAVFLVIGILIIMSVAFLTFRATYLIKHDVSLSRFTNIFSDPSVKTRFSAWQLAWEGFKERPVLGWGQENFISVYTVNRIPFVEEQIWVDRAHNIIMDWLVNAGILGLISYFAIFGAAFYILWAVYQKKKVSKNESFIIATALTVYIIQNLFIFDTINTYLFFFTLLAYIDSFDYTGNAADFSLAKINSKKIKIKSASTALLALLVISAMSYFVNYKPIRESKLFVRTSNNLSNIDSYTELLKDLDNALSLRTFGDTLVRQGMKDLSFLIIKRNLFLKEGALELINASVDGVEEEIAANPYNLENLTKTILFYMKIAKYEPSFLVRAEALIRECMRLNPEYEWPYMALADVHFLRKDYGLAYNNLQKIVDGDPQNDKKLFKLALGAILISRDDVVLGTLENIAKIRIANNALPSNKKSHLSFKELYQLAQAYSEAKNFQKALEYYQEAIRSGDLPGKHKLKEEAKIRIEMAQVYFTVGDKAKALKEAQKAAELDPENLAGGTEQIKSLNN